ncbi:MAG: OmpA family protein [Chitinophagales bacterium]|nr:OmpA family protein [Chitinophagales bacterium]
MKYFLLAVLTPLILFTNAQDGSQMKNVQKYPKVSAAKKLKIGRKKMDEGSYYNAVQYLEDVYKAKPNKIEVPHLLGNAYRYLRDYASAEKYYQAVVTKDKEAYPSDLYYLGVMQKMNGKYEESKKTLQDYLQLPLRKKDENLKGLAKTDLEGCDTALALLASPSKSKVEKAEGGINSTLQDLSPKVIDNNTVMYASQKTDTAVNLNKTDASHYTAIYTSQKSGKSYINKTELPSPPNDPKTNVGNAVISGDGNWLVYTKCGVDYLLANQMRCKLVRSKKEGAGWGEAEELTSLNIEGTTSTQPAFGIDADGNNIIYFVSNREGSKGGLDIFYAKVNNDGTFGAVQNAGDINTVGDEITPYYNLKMNTLYFSSNGHPSIGGLDIFKVTGTPGKWGKVVNAGVPLNSAADDLYLALDEKANKGFLVSNRVGTTSPLGQTCCDDIWTVVIRPEVVLKGIYVKRGDATNTPVEGVDASLYTVAGNNFEFNANVKTDANPFTFVVKPGTSYKLNGNKEGYWPAIDNLTIAEDEDRDTIFQVFYIDPIVKKKIRIPNVYFAFDKSNVIEFYQKEIDSVVNVLNANPGYVVEVQGHTDSKGTDEYNDKLSQRRADEVKKFLIKKKKIADNRIVVKTFGEKMPAVPNELPNGEDDPEGRARNRRVEFRIIPDKPEDAPEFEPYGDPVKETKTGPGFTYGKKK